MPILLSKIKPFSVETITGRQQLQERLNLLRKEGKAIGFVPTMGALHAGHIALVERATTENQVVVASIFVNPTQFNNPNDLLHYPRTLEQDREMLEKAGCSILFLPEVNEMYPNGFVETVPEINLDGLDTVMEGAHRPGHFAGVIQVVKKLFDAVGSCNAYFGKKDFQQLAVIQKMVEEWSLTVKIIPCEIVRESDGLAMSSRNVRLTAEERKVAPLISKAIFQAKEMWTTKTADEIIKTVTAIINSEELFRLEYFEVVDSKTLKPIAQGEKNNAVACIAVHLGSVRLIDNVVLG